MLGQALVRWFQIIGNYLMPVKFGMVNFDGSKLYIL